MKSLKRSFALLIILITVSALLCSCKAENELKQPKKAQGDSFIILTGSDSLDRQIAATLSSYLIEKGHSTTLLELSLPSEKELKKATAVITVGRNVTAEITKMAPDIPHVYCYTDGGGQADNKNTGIAPTVPPQSLADAAMVLLPAAEHFSVISSIEGGGDVQDACDLFDRMAKDYTVETLGGRIYGEVLLSCLESDTDALLLPAGALGNRNASAFALPYIPESEIPVIAVGMGEPIKGALATFCIDSEAISKALLSLTESEVYGHAPTLPDSYYVLCINKKRAATLDERAKKNITELYPVLWIE